MTQPSPFSVRPYRPADRAAVRQLSYDTAKAGRRSTFRDARLQMDLLTRYYTDHEPESCWVLEQEGHVKGYLTGCLDTRRFLHWVKTRGHLITAAALLFRNIHRLEMWRWAQARVKTLREGGAHRPEWTERYPAHLHINLDSSLRARGAGSALLKKFIEQCDAAEIPGIHLSTRADNSAAQRFFEKHGFSRIAMINAYRAGPAGLEPVPVVIMGRRKSPS